MARSTVVCSAVEARNEGSPIVKVPRISRIFPDFLGFPIALAFDFGFGI